jgi:hypothetical protein
LRNDPFLHLTHVSLFFFVFSVLFSLSPFFFPSPCLPFPFLPFLSSFLLPFLLYQLVNVISCGPSVLTLPRYPFAGCANPRVDVAVVFVDGAMEAMAAGGNGGSGGSGGGGKGAAAGRAEPEWINIPDEEYLGTISTHMYLN